MNKRLILCFSVCTLLFTACGEDVYTPKPKGYFRLDFPEKKYLPYNGDCPFYFESPAYSKIILRPDAPSPCWFNLAYPQFNAQLHVSYKEVHDNLREYLEDSRTLTQKHIVKATDIKESLILNDSAKVYGLMYEVKGNVASSVQFYLTDSTKHFLRAALYFNNKPNPDSLAPVVQFLKEDIDHLIESFRWKDVNQENSIAN